MHAKHLGAVCVWGGGAWGEGVGGRGGEGEAAMYLVCLVVQLHVLLLFGARVGTG